MTAQSIESAEASQVFPDMSTKSSDFICDTCCKINFRKLFKTLSKGFSERGASYKVRYTERCVVCRLLFHATNEEPLKRELELCSLSFRRESAWTTQKIVEAKDCVLLRQSLPGPRWKYEDCPVGWVFCVPFDDDDRGLYKPQIVQKTWDHAKARLWLEDCLQHHDLSCGQTRTTIKNMNLIDCHFMTIVKAHESARWIALSYVWGPQPQTSGNEDNISFREGSHLPSVLPQTIEDAISVTKLLGYRFLWVDNYCIDQLDMKHKKEQIGQMDQIYRGTDLTIVAAAGENKVSGLPGVNGTKRKRLESVRVGDFVLFSTGPEPISHIKSSAWFTRAWTFQEGLLSTRLLVFTDYQVSFYCSASSWMEGLGGLEFLEENQSHRHLMPVRSLFTEKQAQNTPTRVDWDQYTNLVTLYSSRNLTFEGEALNAFLGVLHNLRRLWPSAYTLCGLPFFKLSDNRGPDPWSHIVFAAFSWHPTEREEMKRRPMFPSWSWLGWRGRVNFLYTDDASFSYTCTIREVEFEASAEEVIQLPTLSPWESPEYFDTFQSTLDTVIAIRFEAPVIPINLVLEKDSDVTLTRPSKKDNDPRWRRFSVGGAAFDTESRPTAAVLENLVDNLHTGKWSCLLLGHDEDNMYGFRLMLIVQWKYDRQVAERVGAYGLHAKNTVEEDLGPVEELEWRRVSLI